MNDCLLSIIIPLYNAEETIKRCVDSVVQQDMPNYEVLLINDGSTDASGQICDEYAHDYPQVQTFHQPNNGVSAAGNIGLDNARGNYVMFMESDDYLEDGVLSSFPLQGDIVFFDAKKLLKDKSTKILYELSDALYTSC